MREISTTTIKEKIYDMLLEINCALPQDLHDSINESIQLEESPIGIDILNQIQKNAIIAEENNIPMCQDTGMVIVYIEIGQEVQLKGDFIEEAIQDGIRMAYKQGYYRKSIVNDPINRTNTMDNTPGVIHYEIIKGNQVNITVMAKGFGSENMSKICMLKPTDGIKGIKSFVIDTVKKAGSNACPPFFIGIGIGGTFEKCALLAKRALVRGINEVHPQQSYADLEKDLIKCINELGIGPMGMGGRITALDLNIETYPTHIAGLPIAVNICCHVNRHKRTTI